MILLFGLIVFFNLHLFSKYDKTIIAIAKKDITILDKRLSYSLWVMREKTPRISINQSKEVNLSKIE